MYYFFFFFFFKRFLPWASRAVFFPLPIKYVCLRVAEVIIGHSEELCKLFTCLVTWSCRFSLLTGQIGNSLKSLLGLFWLWSSMMLWITLFYAFLHLYDLYDKHLAVNYLLRFFDECRKTSHSLQFFLGLFFMWSQDSWLKGINKCLLNPKALLSSKRCCGLNSLMVNF